MSTWDFSALTGDPAPVELDGFFDEDADDMMPNQLEDMRATPVGGTYAVDLGAGGVLVYRRIS